MFAARYFPGRFFTRSYFPAVGATAAPPVIIPPQGGGGGPRAMHWAPDVTIRHKPVRKTELKRLLRKVAVDDSAAARRTLELRAREAADAVTMIRDVQIAVRELEKEIATKARELAITHQWAQAMIRRMEDEKLILLLLLEEA